MTMTNTEHDAFVKATDNALTEARNVRYWINREHVERCHRPIRDALLSLLGLAHDCTHKQRAEAASRIIVSLLAVEGFLTRYAKITGVEQHVLDCMVMRECGRAEIVLDTVRRDLRELPECNGLRASVNVLRTMLDRFLSSYGMPA